MADPEMRFDINVKDADVREVLGDVFRQAGRAYVFEDEPEGEISMKAADLRFIDALNLLLPTGYTADEIGGVYRIRRMKAA